LTKKLIRIEKQKNDKSEVSDSPIPEPKSTPLGSTSPFPNRPIRPTRTNGTILSLSSPGLKAPPPAPPNTPPSIALKERGNSLANPITEPIKRPQKSRDDLIIPVKLDTRHSRNVNGLDLATLQHNEGNREIQHNKTKEFENKNIPDSEPKEDVTKTRRSTILRTVSKTREMSFKAIDSLRSKKHEFLKNRQDKKDQREKERIEYVDMDKRIKSFTENTNPWPHQKPSAEELAAAGLFFSPKDKKADRTKCYVCGYNFSNWLPVDDPKKEHKKWRPNCPEVIKWGDSVTAEPTPFQITNLNNWREKLVETAHKIKEVKDKISRPSVTESSPAKGRKEPEIPRVSVPQTKIEDMSPDQLKIRIAKSEKGIFEMEKLMSFYVSNPSAQAKVESQLEEQRKELKEMQDQLAKVESISQPMMDLS